MKRDGSKWTSLAALLVFTLFALCLMLVLLTGAGVYRRLTENGDVRYARQTTMQYLSTRFHQGRNARVEDFQGSEALVFSENYGDQTYLTRVYCYDGYLMELFSAEAAQLAPEDGEKILPVSQLAFTLEEDLLCIDLDGETFWLAAREGRQVPHEK